MLSFRGSTSSIAMKKRARDARPRPLWTIIPHAHENRPQPTPMCFLSTSINDHNHIMPSFHSQCGFHTTSFAMSIVAAIAVILLSNKNDDDQGGGGHSSVHEAVYVPIHDHTE